MRNWKEEIGLYEVHEISTKKHEVYCLKVSGNEISRWCKTKNEAYGYISGLGGDRSYTCWAVRVDY